MFHLPRPGLFRHKPNSPCNRAHVEEILAPRTSVDRVCKVTALTIKARCWWGDIHLGKKRLILEDSSVSVPMVQSWVVIGPAWHPRRTGLTATGLTGPRIRLPGWLMRGPIRRHTVEATMDTWTRGRFASPRLPFVVYCVGRRLCAQLLTNVLKEPRSTKRHANGSELRIEIYIYICGTTTKYGIS